MRFFIQTGIIDCPHGDPNAPAYEFKGVHDNFCSRHMLYWYSEIEGSRVVRSVMSASYRLSISFRVCTCICQSSGVSAVLRLVPASLGDISLDSSTYNEALYTSCSHLSLQILPSLLLCSRKQVLRRLLQIILPCIDWAYFLEACWNYWQRRSTATSILELRLADLSFKQEVVLALYEPYFFWLIAHIGIYC